MLRIDIETYSATDIRKCGVYRYVEDASFEVLLFGYAFDQDPVVVVDLAQGERLPKKVVDAMFDPGVIKTAFNANFEIECLSKFFGRKLPANQWRCTQLHGNYLALPGNLAGVCEVLGLGEDVSKKKTGGALIRYFCIPCKPTKKNGMRTRNLPQHDPAKWALFKEYCAGDVIAERAVAKKLSAHPVPLREQKLWEIDHAMLQRGTRVDLDFVRAAVDLAKDRKAELIAEAVALTGVDNPNSRNQLLEWLNSEDESLDLSSLTKKDIPAALAKTNSDVVKRVLELRSLTAKASLSKYEAILRSVCADNAVRGMTDFYGANRTGRWAGRIVQIQNVPSNQFGDVDLARRLVKDKRIEELELLYGPMPIILSQLLRTAFIAREGRVIAAPDYSAIEARMLAWLANCQWRIDVFNSHGKIYEASAEQMFKLPPGSVTKKSPYRQKGKVAELACGFGGGANALIAMGALDMGVPEEELQSLVDNWRLANTAIVRFWERLEKAARRALTCGSRESVAIGLPDFGAKELVFDCTVKGLMKLHMPSGRHLSYVRAQISDKDMFNDKGQIIVRAGSICYQGVHQTTKRWVWLGTWGGKLAENVTQALSRDVLAEAYLRLDSPRFREFLWPLFSVHDELVAELATGQDQVTLHDVEQEMGRAIDWAPGLPLRADGFTAEFYQKEAT